MLARKVEDERYRRFSQRIVSAAEHAAELTDQILTFARKGHFDTLSPIDMHGVIADAVALLQYSIDKRMRITQQLAAAPSPTLGDAAQLQSAILNIALNANDAVPDIRVTTAASAPLPRVKALASRPPCRPRQRTGLTLGRGAAMGVARSVDARHFEKEMQCTRTAMGRQRRS